MVIILIWIVKEYSVNGKLLYGVYLKNLDCDLLVDNIKVCRSNLKWL